MNDRLLIFLHGVGSSGQNMTSLALQFADSLPNTALACPDGPEVSSFGSGHQWFSVNGVTDDNRAGRIAAARAGFDAVISDCLAAHGFENRLDRVALIGFSQGTIMGLDAIATGRWPVAAFIGFSGWLASALPLTPSVSTKVLLVHGTIDNVIAPAETTRASETLRAAGLSVETLLIAGLGHGIADQGAQKAIDFITQHLA